MIRVNLNEYNERIANFNDVKLRALHISKNSVVFNNGVELTTDSEIRKFRRGVKNNSVEFIKRLDIIYGKDLELAHAAIIEIKSINARKGGKAVQEKYGKRVLNTGTPWNKGMKGNYPYHFPRSASTKLKISEKNRGDKNGMYGKTMNTAQRAHQSLMMKQAILDGRFTPNSNNRNSHWTATFDDMHYRSSWEALFHYLTPTAEYETFRIEYILDNVKKIYIVDFIDRLNKVLIEVKPKELCAGVKYEAKIKALLDFATVNDYRILIATKEWLLQQNKEIDYSRFDELTATKIKILYETNKTYRNN